MRSCYYYSVILRTNLVKIFLFPLERVYFFPSFVPKCPQHLSLTVRNLQRNLYTLPSVTRGGEPGNKASLLREFCTATHNAAEDWERGCLIPRSFTSVMEPSHSM